MAKKEITFSTKYVPGISASQLRVTERMVFRFAGIGKINR